MAFLEVTAVTGLCSSCLSSSNRCVLWMKAECGAGKVHYSSTSQASACEMFVNVPLAQVSFMARARGRARAGGLCPVVWQGHAFREGGEPGSLFSPTYHMTFVYTFYISTETKKKKAEHICLGTKYANQAFHQVEDNLQNHNSSQSEDPIINYFWLFSPLIEKGRAVLSSSDFK